MLDSTNWSKLKYFYSCISRVRISCFTFKQTTSPKNHHGHSKKNVDFTFCTSETDSQLFLPNDFSYTYKWWVGFVHILYSYPYGDAHARTLVNNVCTGRVEIARVRILLYCWMLIRFKLHHNKIFLYNMHCVCTTRRVRRVRFTLRL